MNKKRIILRLILGATTVIIFITLSTHLFFYISKMIEEKEVMTKNNILMDSIAKTKHFDTLAIEQIGISKITLKAKFIDEEIKYILTASIVDSLDIPLKTTTPIPLDYPSSNDKLIIQLYDDDGFVIGTEDVYLNSVTRLKNKSGLYVGFENAGNLSLKKDLYIKAKKWNINWAF